MNNPPAFPQKTPSFSEDRSLSGMTLRDYFAAKAMQIYAKDDDTFVNVASESYRMADALLKEREKQV